MTMEDRVRRYIRANRRAGSLRRIAHLASRFLNAWHNTGHYDFEQNGEAFALKCARQAISGPAIVLWDVGAHDGEYAAEAHRVIPEAQIRSFEILPPIAERLRSRGFDPSWFALSAVGLSNEPGRVDIAFNHAFDTTSTIHRPHAEHFKHEDIETVACEVTTIDQMILDGVAPPNILKIDVEGHEASVIDGARALLASAAAPAMIQFEYGGTWIAASKMLCEVQLRLEAAGYSVGRLYPDHVAFKKYEHSDDHFRMGNMIAARGERLVRLLTN